MSAATVELFLCRLSQRRMILNTIHDTGFDVLDIFDNIHTYVVATGGMFDGERHYFVYELP